MVLLPLVLVALAFTEPRLILEDAPAVTLHDLRIVIRTWKVAVAVAALAVGITANAKQGRMKRSRVDGFIFLSSTGYLILLKRVEGELSQLDLSKQ